MVTVNIRLDEISSNSMAYDKDLFDDSAFKVERIITELSSVGGIVVKDFLKLDFASVLLEEIKIADYQPQPNYVEKVTQELDLCVLDEADRNKPDHNGYANTFMLRDTFLKFMKTRGQNTEISEFFPKLNFDSVYLQRYQRNSRGVSAHKDHKRYINLICIFSLGADSRFLLYNSNGSAKGMDASHGSLIMLRAPGFPFSGASRPLHSLEGPKENIRYSISLRQTS